MLICKNQAGTAAYFLYYYHLKQDPDTQRWHMVGMSRPSLQEMDLVDLGSYKYYEQATWVFGQMLNAEGDLVYFKKAPPTYMLPPSIETEEGLRKFLGI